jgi:peptide deformylase
MIRDLQTGNDNRILRTKSSSISKMDRHSKKLMRDMKATVKPNGGMGIAAPQVGENVRIILINVPADLYQESGFEECTVGEHYLLINPELTWVSPEQSLFEEGCLSLPDFYGQVMRPNRVQFRGQREDGSTVEGTAEGMFARILQHEVDHINGILFRDKLHSGTGDTSHALSYLSPSRSDNS